MNRVIFQRKVFLTVQIQSKENQMQEIIRWLTPHFLISKITDSLT
jgi:hypothetical protein